MTGGQSLTLGWGQHPPDHQGRAMPPKAKEGIEPSREPATLSWALLAGPTRYPKCPPGRSRLPGPCAMALRSDEGSERPATVWGVSWGRVAQHHGRAQMAGSPLSLSGGVTGPRPLPWTPVVCWRSLGLLSLWTRHPAQLHLHTASPCTHLRPHFLLYKSYWARAPLRPRFHSLFGKAPISK